MSGRYFVSKESFGRHFVRKERNQLVCSWQRETIVPLFVLFCNYWLVLVSYASYYFQNIYTP